MAYFHSKCAQKYLDARSSMQRSCPACLCLVCGGGHFKSPMHMKPIPLHVDTIPVGCPKNICTVELPRKNYVEMEWVHAIMDMRPLVANAILRSEEGTYEKTIQHRRQESQACSTPADGIVSEAFALAKNCGTWQQLYSILKPRLLGHSSNHDISTELQALRLALIPTEEFEVIFSEAVVVCALGN